MLRLTHRLAPGQPADTTLTLRMEARAKHRLRVILDDGREAGLFLDRGGCLRDGDLLAADGGAVVQVRAAPEPVSTLRCVDPLALARACYHLGNRHVPLQIGPGWLRYLQDPLLDHLARHLGLEPLAESVPFDPEPGVYGGPHGHGDDHD